VEFKVIGIAGVARVGKDTFCESLIDILKSQGIKAQRVAFADALKQDIASLLEEKLGHKWVDKLGVNPYIKDKEIIRPLYVAYGKLMRDLTQDAHWVNKVKEKVETNRKKNIISLISDVRYADEVNWINSTRGGATVYLNREGFHPINEEEVINDPLARSKCTYQVQWTTETEGSTPTFLESLRQQTLHHLNASPELLPGINRP
tara:strand:+ start:88 stop:699 length:612 start_codon:yes stop_codon:yes gene_type:complete